MKRNILMAAGGLVTLVGLLFLLQGSNVLKGSAMSDNHFWIYGGLVIALIEKAVLMTGLRTVRTVKAR